MINEQLIARINPKEEIKHILVKEKATGGLVALESMKQFNPSMHERMPELNKPEVFPNRAETNLNCINCGKSPTIREQALTSQSSIPISQDVANKDVNSNFDTSGQERYKELKELKAWLKPELKDEYYALKKTYG